MTSGGLDSASAAATAARQLAPAPLRTYTSAPPPGWSVGERPGWDADESPLVRALAERHPNISPTFVHVPRGESLFDLHEPVWELGAGPMRNPCNGLWVHAIAARAQVDGVSTLLSGARGNMFFSADGPAWLASLLRAGRLGAIVREAASWSRRSGEGPFRTLAGRVAYPLLPMRAKALARAAYGRAATIREWLTTIALRSEVVDELDLPSLLPVLDERTDPRELAMFVVQAGATQADTQSAMAALRGVEERDPTVDRRLLEVAMRQPEWVRRHDGITRAVARGAMADRLPAAIVRRTRRGEQLPDWLDVMSAARPELAAELEALEDHPTSRELIDTARLRALMERWPERTSRADERVVREYRLALLRSLVVSRYLRWFERRAAGGA
jgi:asparagine synthase (glutamine-hydrolysing)